MSLLAAVVLFASCILAGAFAVAWIHALLVHNQARLDEIHLANEQRQAEISRLQGEVAFLDSPEGVAEQATSGGLVPAVEVVTLARLADGALPPPGLDPFALSELDLAGTGRTGADGGYVFVDGDSAGAGDAASPTSATDAPTNTDVAVSANGAG